MFFPFRQKEPVFFANPLAFSSSSFIIIVVAFLKSTWFRQSLKAKPKPNCFPIVFFPAFSNQLFFSPVFPLRFSQDSKSICFQPQLFFQLVSTLIFSKSCVFNPTVIFNFDFLKINGFSTSTVFSPLFQLWFSHSKSICFPTPLFSRSQNQLVFKLCFYFFSFFWFSQNQLDFKTQLSSTFFQPFFHFFAFLKINLILKLNLFHCFFQFFDFLKINMIF